MCFCVSLYEIIIYQMLTHVDLIEKLLNYNTESAEGMVE